MEVFTVEIECKNVAFAPEPRVEIARILHAIAAHVEGGRLIRADQPIHDVNGNEVGYFALKLVGRNRQVNDSPEHG